MVDKLPMKGISLILGNEVKTKKCHPCKMAKISAKNEERKMARMNAKHEDNMAAEPRAKYKRHSRSQSEKVLFTNPSARAGYDTRSVFKRSLTGLNSEFSFS